MANIISYLFSAADASGQPIAEVQVEITYLSPDIGFPPIGTIYSVQTQANGSVFVIVPEGVYDIYIAKAGYTTYTQQSLALHDGGSSAITLQGGGSPPPPQQNILLPIGFTIGAAALIYYVITR